MSLPYSTFGPKADFDAIVNRIRALEALLLNPKEFYRQKLLEAPRNPLCEFKKIRGMGAGIYGIGRDGQFLYLGKSIVDVYTRIKKYAKDLSIKVGDISQYYYCACKFIDFSPSSHEDLIIKEFRPLLNGSGLGNNDPGKNRRQQKPSAWLRLDPDSLTRVN